MSRPFDPSQHGGDNMDGFTQPPPADYLVRIEEAELKTSQSSGANYINLTLRVAFGEFENSKFWDTASLLDNAIWKLGDCCKSVGQNSVFDIESQSAIKKALEGKVGKVKTKWEEYEGQKKTKVAKWITCTDEERARAGGRSSDPDAPTPPSGGGGAPRSSGGSSAHDDIPF